MLDDITKSPLYRIANPRSLAFYGASNNIGSMGTNQLLSLLSLGFEGAVFPVHPKEDTVLGLQAYRSVLDLPETPDVAVMVLPARVVCQCVDDCGRKGVRHAIIVSGGFREAGGRGVEMERELVETAARHGIRILGPNGLGVANPHHNLNTTFIGHEGRPGFIGLASQSGSFVTQMFDYLANLGLGFSTAFSVGNEANTDLVDCLEYLGACPHTLVIGMYIEGIRRGRDFVEAARQIAPHKPIVAYYVGGSDAGSRAGFSHTGAMAGPDALYDGIFRQGGVIRAAGVTELFDFCSVLGGQPRPRGNRVVIQTHSGGPGAVAADLCGRAGLEVPELAPDTLEKLAQHMPDTGSVNNPVDITFTHNPMDLFSTIPRLLVEDANTDILLMYLMTPSVMVRRAMEHMGVAPDQVDEETSKVLTAQASALLDAVTGSDKPVVGYTWRNLGQLFYKTLLEGGLPVLPGAERAARALGAMVQYNRLRQKLESSARAGEAARSDGRSSTPARQPEP
jgi:acyl-CoA synthetase (NDP forming)